MRPAKVPGEVVYKMVWESLCRRMDPETHRVRPSWLALMREIGVCRQRIADAIHDLKAEGRLKVVTIPRLEKDEKRVDYFYEVEVGTAAASSRPPRLQNDCENIV